MKFFVLSFVFIISSVMFAHSSLDILDENSYYGICVKDLGGANEIVSINKDKSFSPASLTKLITTATALEMLGSEFRYETRVAYSDEIVNGTLKGDLFIIGSGDPTLGSCKFSEDVGVFIDQWVDDIVACGIKEIDGSILADASVFDNQAIPDKWIWEDIGNYYGAGVYGLSCFDNMYKLYFSSEEVGELAQVDSVVPNMDKMCFDSQVIGANIKYDNAYIYGSPTEHSRIIRGEIPAHRDAFVIKGAMPNPPLFLADLLKEELQKKGIAVRKESKIGDAYDKAGIITVVSSTFSPTLAEIVRITNKESNNLFAEHLLKSIVIKLGNRLNTELALQVLVDFWKMKGIPSERIKLYDGSGLARANLLTPEFILAVIDYMSQSKNAEAFYNSLAISAEDGTFKYFLKGTNLAGLVHGKSGSMSGVRCYAGIIEYSETKRYSFCVMVNNFTITQAEIIKAVEIYLLECLPVD